MVNPTNVVDVFLEEDPEPYVTVNDISKAPVVVEVAEGTVAPPAFLSGYGTPSADLGNPGQFYLDHSGGNWYGPKTEQPVSSGPSQWLYPNDPALGNAGAQPVGGSELGVNFRVTETGEIVGMRVYKHPSSTQTSFNIRLWTGSGTQLAAAVGNLYSPGWGNVWFGMPIVVVPGNFYTVSYTVPAGIIGPATAHASAPATNTSHLEWWSSRYATGGSFPASEPQPYNYGADVIINPTSVWKMVPDPPEEHTHPPHTHEPEVINGTGPPTNAIGAIGQFYVDKTTGTLYGPKFDHTQSQTLYPTIQPAWNVSAGNATGFSLGQQFTVKMPGRITAFRFYRPDGGAPQTARTIRLWSATGTLLTTATTVNETGFGWITATLGAPYVINPGSYLVSYDVAINAGFASLPPTPAPWVSGPSLSSVASFHSGSAGVGTYPITPGNAYGADVVYLADSPWPVAGVDPPRPAQVDAFTVGGTWTWNKPVGAKTVTVISQGAGGGGGGGGRHPAGQSRYGASAGGGGAWVLVTYAAADLPAQVTTIVVGIGGAGGAGATVDNTNGADGGAGGWSRFGNNAIMMPNGASGGGGGRIGSTPPVGGGPLGAMQGGAGGLPGGGTPSYNGMFLIASMGGGGGAGITGAEATGAGGASFAGVSTQGYAVVAGGTAGGGVGGTNVYLPTVPEPWPPGAGGGGGGSSTTTAGGKGGDGNRGGGGGGGGAAANGFNGGAGGKGGDGFVQVITYF